MSPPRQPPRSCFARPSTGLARRPAGALPKDPAKAMTRARGGSRPVPREGVSERDRPISVVCGLRTPPARQPLTWHRSEHGDRSSWSSFDDPIGTERSRDQLRRPCRDGALPKWRESTRRRLARTPDRSLLARPPGKQLRRPSSGPSRPRRRDGAFPWFGLECVCVAGRLSTRDMVGRLSSGARRGLVVCVLCVCVWPPLDARRGINALGARRRT